MLCGVAWLCLMPARVATQQSGGKPESLNAGEESQTRRDCQVSPKSDSIYFFDVEQQRTILLYDGL